MKTLVINILILLCLSNCISCKRKDDHVEIKLLLLNSESYYHQGVTIKGKVKEVGPLSLWFILEDESAFIQVTTQKIPSKITCLKNGSQISVFGELEQYGVHKYFSLQKNLKCP